MFLLYLHPARGLGMSGAIPPLTLYTFMAWTGKRLICFSSYNLKRRNILQIVIIILWHHYCVCVCVVFMHIVSNVLLVDCCSYFSNYDSYPLSGITETRSELCMPVSSFRWEMYTIPSRKYLETRRPLLKVGRHKSKGGSWGMLKWFLKKYGVRIWSYRVRPQAVVDTAMNPQVSQKAGNFLTIPVTFGFWRTALAAS